MPAARGAGGCEKYDSIRFMHPSKRYFVVVAILAVALSLSACSRTTPAAQTQKDELPTGGELAQKLEHATGTQANADVTAVATDDVGEPVDVATEVRFDVGGVSQTQPRRG